MARKHSLTNLTKEKLTAVNSGNQNSETARGLNGTVAGSRRVIGAVSQSFEKLKAQGIVELDPNLIDPPTVRDRMGLNEECLDQLTQQIQETGQLVPILVRNHPEIAGRYQLAYGWRRTQAAKQLGIPVKGVVKPLSDDELVVAQGQENNARQDLSFIEKALYATNLEAAGYDRHVIMNSLGIDKTTCSRLISTTTRIPKEIVEAIGPAPKTGRDRWVELALLFETSAAKKNGLKQIESAEFLSLSSDDRFNLIIEKLKKRKPSTNTVDHWKDQTGKKIAKIKRGKDALTLVVNEKVAPDFGEFLVDALPELYLEFLNGPRDTSLPIKQKDT